MNFVAEINRHVEHNIGQRRIVFGQVGNAESAFVDVDLTAQTRQPPMEKFFLAEIKVRVEKSPVKVAVDVEVDGGEVKIIIREVQAGKTETARQGKSAAADIARKFFYIESLALKCHGNIYVLNQTFH